METEDAGKAYKLLSGIKKQAKCQCTAMLHIISAVPMQTVQDKISALLNKEGIVHGMLKISEPTMEDVFVKLVRK